MGINRIKPIRNDDDYQEALAFLEELIDAEPSSGTTTAEQLEILSSLIQSYEDEHFAIDLPDAIEAIKFVMEQRDLEPKDLIPYLGSKSRVSEVLSGKRSLSIEMIRSLEAGLGIPAKALIKKPEPFEGTAYGTWDEKVFAEMNKRGYFDDLKDKAKEKADLLKLFFESINRQSTVQALLRQSSYRTATSDKTALTAWTGFVLKKADTVKIPDNADGSININFMHELVRLSVDDIGPLKARDLLLSKGIKLIIEPAFPKTRIDGATIFTEEYPIIGLTLRHDRLDNFWFTLMHELAHIVLHSDTEDKIDVYYDEIYEIEKDGLSTQEIEADELAGESLIPLEEWEDSAAHLIPSEITFTLLANKLGIHPCIVAGKHRYESKDWNKFTDMIKGNKVSHLFQEA